MERLPAVAVYNSVNGCKLTFIQFDSHHISSVQELDSFSVVLENSHALSVQRLSLPFPILGHLLDVC